MSICPSNSITGMEFDRLSIIAPLLVIEMIATDTVICNGRERHKSRERRESKIYTIMEDREVRQKNLIQSLNTGSGGGRVQDVGHPSTERLYTRQLLELEQQRRLINRQTINADISLSGIEDIDPILRMVAQVRASYLKALFDLARENDGLPTPVQIETLRDLRESYDELVNASNALETALERGYIDLESVESDQ